MITLFYHCQNKEKVIADLRDGQRDVSKDDEAIIEQIKMEKSMIEQQLGKAEKQLEQLRTELMVCHNIVYSDLTVVVLYYVQELETSSAAQLDHVSSQLKETEETLNREKNAHNETRAILSHTKEVSEEIM